MLRTCSARFALLPVRPKMRAENGEVVEAIPPPAEEMISAVAHAHSAAIGIVG